MCQLGFQNADQQRMRACRWLEGGTPLPFGLDPQNTDVLLKAFGVSLTHGVKAVAAPRNDHLDPSKRMLKPYR